MFYLLRYFYLFDYNCLFVCLFIDRSLYNCLVNYCLKNIVDAYRFSRSCFLRSYFIHKMYRFDTQPTGLDRYSTNFGVFSVIKIKKTSTGFYITKFGLLWFGLPVYTELAFLIQNELCDKLCELYISIFPMICVFDNLSFFIVYRSFQDHFIS